MFSRYIRRYFRYLLLLSDFHMTKGSHNGIFLFPESHRGHNDLFRKIGIEFYSSVKPLYSELPLERTPLYNKHFSQERMK